MIIDIDEFCRRRLQGWEASHWVYVSTVGKINALGDVVYLREAESYEGVHGASVMVITSQKTAAKAYEIADKAIKSGVSNLAVWVIEWPQIAELVAGGYRHQTPQKLPMTQEFTNFVRDFSEAMSA